MMINGTHSTTSSGGGGMEMSVLERQTAVLKWQQHHHHLQISQFPQQQQSYFTDLSMSSMKTQLQNFHAGLLLGAGDSVLNEPLTTRPIKPDPSFESGSGWPEYGVAGSTTTSMDKSSGFGHGVLNYGSSRTASCPPAATVESFRKRKADQKSLLPPKAETEDESRAKKVKRGSCEVEELVPKQADQNNNNTKNSNNSKNGNKESKIKENSDAHPDYIRVRARRGQATDSHSLAERVRREKISERMKYLQDLVPGCNKITGKAGMLDEIINYVQSLQRQVEFLSMKLAAINPTLDYNIEDLFAKQAFQSCSSNFPASGISSEMANFDYLQFNQEQQMGCGSASDLGMSEVELEIRRTISAPVSIPETFLDSSCLTQQIQTHLPWDQSGVQTIYNLDFQLARQQSFPSQTYRGAN